MIQVFWVGVIALVASASGQRASYVDYDYHDVSAVRQAAPAPRSAYASPVVASPRASAQSVQPRPTPVPILKQINKHNDDGSYTYGYEGADGSFKIETKLPTGEVMGKYGYVDDTGKLRVIDYGANKYGFQPAGEGITVAPPTLVDETLKEEERKGTFAEYDDEPVYTVEQRPQRPQKRPQQAPARSYTGFEQQLRQSPTPSYQELQFAATPAPVRFAPPARRPSPARYAPAPQVQIPQEIQQIPQHIPQQIQQQIPQQIPQQIQQQIPQQIQQQIPQHIPQQIQRQVPQVQRQIPQQIQRQVPQQVQRHIPQRIPHQIPEQVQIQQQLAHIPPQSPVPQRASIPGAVPAGQVYAAAPSPQPRPAPVREAPGSASGTFLDTLIKQYSLPAGVGQPLHDISFGSYSSQTNY